MPKRQPCIEPDCGRPKTPGRHRCRWHYLLKLEPEARVRDADARLRHAREDANFVHRARVPESEWPAGQRWCSGCQSFVPLFYVTGSRCKGCASRASHESHLKRTYGISREDYEALYRFQGGICYICHRPGRTIRLAVDHDHRTGEIRGLLCSSDEWGCNVSLRRLLNDEAMALRALEYVKSPPWTRLRQGQEAPERPRRPSTSDLIAAAGRPQGATSAASGSDSTWHLG